MPSITPRLPHAMNEVSQSDIFVRGRDEDGLFRAVFFHIMSHLSDTSAGFGGKVVRRTTLRPMPGGYGVRSRRVSAHRLRAALTFRPTGSKASRGSLHTCTSD